MYPQMPEELRETIHQQGQAAMDLHKKLLDWQMSQAELAWKQMTAAWELTRNTTRAQADAALGLQKTLLDTFAPAKATDR